MIIIKLGGSIITNKKVPLRPRTKAVRDICRSIKRIDEPVILVHGGGSFGHYWSVRYDMHTEPRRYDIHGVSVVNGSMMALNSIITKAASDAGLDPYCIPPSVFMRGTSAIPSKIRQISQMAGAGLTPVTFGDAAWLGDKKSYILSGDRIMTILARTLRPRLSIFVLDVDGLYSDIDSGSLIHDANKQKSRISEITMDVTGGMKRKVKEARAISRTGVDVAFVNGRVPRRIVDATRTKKFRGTLFGGRR